MSNYQLRINKVVSLFLLTFLFFIFSGCDGIKGKLLVMEANMQTSQLEHSDAISNYTEALPYFEAAPYAEYGLGVTYLLLGEDDSAFQRFDNAAELINSESADYDQELDYRIHYNRGILYFHASRFDEAALEFRKALEIDESRVEAKRNLELSLLSEEQQNSAVSSSPVELNNDQGQDNTMFDYLRQKEIDSWHSKEPEEDQDSPWLDY
jgi:Ca-activated chloride channel family protein